VFDAPVTPRGRATYEALLQATESEIARVGFDRTTSTTVASCAGVATGTFYTYFTDKDALLSALFARRLDDILAAVESALTSDNLLDHGLDRTLGTAVDIVLDAYRRHAGVLRAALARVPASPVLRDIYWTRHSAAVDVIERFLRRGAAAGLVRLDATDVLAHTLLVVIQALNHPVLLADLDGPLARAIRAQLVRTLVTLLTPVP
jgi:AcrR family transcriptional regulator